MGSIEIKSKDIDVQVSEENLEYIKKRLWKSFAEIFNGAREESSSKCKEAEVAGKDIRRILKDALKELRTERPGCSLDKYDMFGICYMILINNGVHVYMSGGPSVARTYGRLQDLGIKKRYKVIITDDDEGVIRDFKKIEKLVSRSMDLPRAATQTEHSDGAAFGTEKHEIFTSRWRSIREVNLKDLKHNPENDERRTRFKKELFKKVDKYLGTSQTARGEPGRGMRYRAYYTSEGLFFKGSRSRPIDQAYVESSLPPVPIRAGVSRQFPKNSSPELDGEKAASEIVRLASSENVRSREKLRRWFLFNFMDGCFPLTFRSGNPRKTLFVEAKDLNVAPAMLIGETPVIFIRKNLCYRLCKADDVKENLYLEKADYCEVERDMREAPRVQFCDPLDGKDMCIDLSLCRRT